MTIPASTIPAVCSYLEAQVLAAIADDPAASSIYVSIGNPGKKAGKDNIIIGSDQTVGTEPINRRTEPWQLVGSGAEGWLKELVELPCLVYAWSGDEPVNVMSRGFQLLDYLETAIRTDPSLGGLVWESHTGTHRGGSPCPIEQGYESRIELTVHYEAGL